MNSENATNDRLRDEITELNNDIQDECMARAKATQPRTSEEALECAMGAAGSVIYSAACVQKVNAKLVSAAVDILRASVYLDGGTFAGRDPEDTAEDEAALDFDAANDVLSDEWANVHQYDMHWATINTALMLARETAEMVARMHVVFAHVESNADERDREAIIRINEDARRLIAEIVTLYKDHYAENTAESDGDAR